MFVTYSIHTSRGVTTNRFLGYRLAYDKHTTAARQRQILCDGWSNEWAGTRIAAHTNVPLQWFVQQLLKTTQKTDQQFFHAHRVEFHIFYGNVGTRQACILVTEHAEIGVCSCTSDGGTINTTPAVLSQRHARTPQQIAFKNGAARAKRRPFKRWGCTTYGMNIPIPP